MKRFFIAAIFFAAMFLAVPHVLAHANLVRSDPPAGSAQKIPPLRVRLWFSEDIEPSFSSASVLDRSGAQLDKRDSHRLSDDPKAMEVSVNALPEGLYTVVWKALSAVDGHATNGSFSFTVGDVPLSESSPRQVMALVDAALSAYTFPPLYEIAVRWLNLLLLIALAGSFFFPLLILLPAIQIADKSNMRGYVGYLEKIFRNREIRGQEKNYTALESWSRRWLPLAIYFFVFYCLITITALMAQSFTAGDGLAAIPRVITATRFGTVWLFRVAVLIALGVVLFRSRWQWSLNPRGNRSLLAASALGIALCFSQSLNSHGAAVTDPPLVALVIDLIHLLGTAVWVGGLFQLLITLPAFLRALPAPEQSRKLSAVIGCFSLVAFIAVGIIIASGAYALLVQVGSLEAFFETLYGTTLFVKFLLIAPLLALGAFNLIVNRADARQVLIARAQSFISQTPRHFAVRRFDLAVALEVILAIAILLVVGLLTSVAPARGAYDPSPKLLMQTNKVDDLFVTLGVAPGLVGTNDFDVKVQDASGQPVSDARVVRLLGAMPAMDMGVQEIATTPQGNGHYTWRGDLLSMIGQWDIETLVRREGRDDARTAFSFLALAQRPAPAGQLPALERSETWVGLGMTLAAFAFGVAVVLLGKVKQRTIRATLGGSIVLSILGALLVYQTAASVAAPIVIIPVAPPAARLTRSPIRPDAANLAAGQQIYSQNCAVCHGTAGLGDGPAAANLNPKPFDLTVHARAHTEGELFWWVSKGISGTAMVSWEAALGDLQRWQVVAYIRTLGLPSAPQSNSAPSQNPTQASSANLEPNAPLDPTASDVIAQNSQVSGLNITLAVKPRTAGLSDFDVILRDANGRAIDDAPRVMLVFAMGTMAHGANSVDAAPIGGGHYRARGPWLFMEGPWAIGLIVRLAEGQLRSAVFALNAPEPPPGNVESRAIESSPTPFQQVNVAIYPSLIDRPRVDVQAKQVHVTALLIDPSKERCGGRIVLPELGQEAAFGDAGIAELEFVPPRSGELRIKCTKDGVMLAIKNPLDPDN